MICRSVYYLDRMDEQGNSNKQEDFQWAINFMWAKNGCDTFAGSRERPLKTIQAAADLARPGDKIIVHEGIYREYVIRNAGAPMLMQELPMKLPKEKKSSSPAVKSSGTGSRFRAVFIKPFWPTPYSETLILTSKS